MNLIKDQSKYFVLIQEDKSVLTHECPASEASLHNIQQYYHLNH